MRSLKILIVPLLALVQSSLGAQNVNDRILNAPHLFLERSKIALGTPTPYEVGVTPAHVFQGQPALHLFLWNTFDHDWQAKGKSWGWAGTFTFNSVLRMFATPSQPVRTPSLNPGGRFQFVYLAERKIVDNAYETVSLGDWYSDGLPFFMFAIQGGFFHYSNGQEGCTFLDFSPNPSNLSQCIPNPSLSGVDITQWETNRINGSFSVNYFPVEVWLRWGAVHADRGLINSLALGFIYRRLVPVDAYMDEAVGSNHFRVELEGELGTEYLLNKSSENGDVNPFAITWGGVLRLRLAAELWLSTDPTRLRPLLVYSPFSFEAELAYTFNQARHFGFYAKVRAGTDDYNINFSEGGLYVEAGLMFDYGRLDSLFHNPTTPPDSSGGVGDPGGFPAPESEAEPSPGPPPLPGTEAVSTD